MARARERAVCEMKKRGWRVCDIAVVTNMKHQSICRILAESEAKVLRAKYDAIIAKG